MNYYQYPPFIGYNYPGTGMNQMYPGMGMNQMQPGFFPQYQQQQQINGEGEQSYIENILRLNLGKHVSIYMNFESSQWGSKIFKGILEAAGTDHIIISDPNNSTRYLLLTIYLNYITFDDEINYYYPYQTQQQPQR